MLDDGSTGNTEVTLRDAREPLSPADWLDLSLGKQVAAWHVGDFLFINGLSPKNWMAIYLSRGPEFWKDSTNALRLTFCFADWTWDAVYHPQPPPPVVGGNVRRRKTPFGV